MRDRKELSKYNEGVLNEFPFYYRVKDLVQYTGHFFS